MARVVGFPRIEPHYVFDRSGISFFAVADGNVLKCFVSAEALFDHFRARDFSEQECLRAFLENREAIEAVARQKIVAGSYQRGAEVPLMMSDFGPPSGRNTTSPQPSPHGYGARYSSQVIETPAALKAAQEATTFLREGFGTASAPVDILWDIVQLPGQPSLLSLTLRDGVTGHAVNGLYTIDDLSDRSDARFSLYRLWDDMLRERIRRQLDALTPAGSEA